MYEQQMQCLKLTHANIQVKGTYVDFSLTALLVYAHFFQ